MPHVSGGSQLVTLGSPDVPRSPCHAGSPLAETTTASLFPDTVCQFSLSKGYWDVQSWGVRGGEATA